jgi:hypothetical protein
LLAPNAQAEGSDVQILPERIVKLASNVSVSPLDFRDSSASGKVKVPVSIVMLDASFRVKLRVPETEYIPAVVRLGVIVRAPGASDQDVAVMRSGPTAQGVQTGPVVASTAIPVVPTPVVKLTVVEDAVPNVVMDCAAALLDPMVTAKIANPNDIKNFLITPPQNFHNTIMNYKDLTALSGLGSPRLLLVRIFVNTVIP